MPNSMKLSGIFLLFTLIGLAAGPAFAAPPDNFTAKMVAMGITMPMARMGNKTLMENVMMGGIVTISIHDQKKTITINHKNKVYFEQTITDKIPALEDPKVVFEKKKIGAETIDGHPCIKYDAIFYSKDRPEQKFKAILWEAQDLGGLPIKHEIKVEEGKKLGGKDGKIVSELKEIKVGAAKASMFEIPSGYKKAGSMQEVMGMGGPMGGGDMKQMQEMMKQMKKGMKGMKGPEGE